MRLSWRDADRDFRKHLPGGETTERHLTEVLHSVRTDFKPLPGFDPNKDDLEYFRAQQGIDCDEVYPGIFIGDEATAKNKNYLAMIGITHLLNAAEGKKFGFVNTDRNYYSNTRIKYLGLPLADCPSVDISKYFYTAASFIDEAVSNNGKVFVHCVVGVSRSATCVLAYLMIKKNMLAVDAVRIVREKRDIYPNYGFRNQLAQLDNQLRRQRL
ncbi:PREDICTED: dual specificity protein phosphatase 3-like isoform X1 [Polistes dominula]|uniref:Dual specificity protein phosphatase n=1 Tax=Polistes dominula TaxID=743375 RepID=A0ABM1IHL4_POLDO|nr:PREDICTED: dual specificity protein phosphatase 3-like isoform X1 [Polistes dominula]